MSTDAKSITEQSVERADPEEMAGSLMESEHRSRYLWAAQLAEGRSVLDAGCGTGYGTEILAALGAENVVGIDISPEAIEYARSSFEGVSSKFSLGDIYELPFEDDTFELVVCFEVIEHVEEQQRAIGELHRVLRASGVLAISSPNRGVYPPGNPYHIHEYQPDELKQALAGEFSHVRLYRQSPWLTAAVLDDERSQAMGSAAAITLNVIKTRSIEPGAETFTIALASESELPAPADLAVMGDPFEVGWWEERLKLVSGERDRERGERDRERAKFKHEFLEQGRALLAVEAHLVDAHNEIARLQSADSDLRQWVEQIRGAADSAIQRAAERETLARHRGDDFEKRLRRAERTIDDITGSLSWRLSGPLRTVMRLLRG